MIAIVLGTRPEIIKLSPLIRACEERDYPHYILHTGQHYSYEMDRVFFDELSLPPARYHLDVGSGTHSQQTGQIMVGVEGILAQDPPDIVLVQGDTNTVLAASLAAAKLHVPVGHVEAGLRSFDRSMPEEINRIVADHLSDYLFAPTPRSRQNLRNEGIAEEKIFTTGNTVVDAILQNRTIAETSVTILSDLHLTPRHYLLATTHRAENVDNKIRLRGIMEGLTQISRHLSFPLILPLHPRTAKMVEQFGIPTDGLTLIPPTGYLEFLSLEASARLILTDSGGVQEEACILGIPCVTLRDTTERPETIDVGANILAGTSTPSIMEKAEMMLEIPRTWQNPFGDGHAGDRIIEILAEKDDIQ